jgi:signal transduction histidine kinase
VWDTKLKVRVFSIRWKIICLFGASIFMSAICVTGLVQLAHSLAHSLRWGVVFQALRILQRNIGEIPLSLLAGFAFFILFFFLLSRESILYLEEISRVLHEISLGNFNASIRAGSRDELGELGENIMQMAARLKQWMAEEKEAERIKHELITSVSHDLRTPLTSILGYLELIEKDGSNDIAALRRNAGIAYQKSQQLKKLIDDLFEYTTVSHGMLQLKLARIDLKALIGQLAEEFVPVLQAAGMEYRLLLPDDDCFVMADGDLLVRVFQNLVSNAIRYGRTGIYVDLKISRTEEWLAALVINYGNPIAPDDLTHIFERFYRVKSSDSDQIGSTGLGLAIARNIVNLHLGTLTAISDAEKTIFEVKLKLT